jgi:hypothetical protein
MKHIEDGIQAGIVRALRYMYPQSVTFAIPNGGQRNKATGAIMKATGTLAGCSDLVFLHKSSTYFIEVKGPKGTQTDSQKEFQKRVEKQGFKYYLVRSTDEILQIIENL